MEDERIDYIKPMIHQTEAKPLLYRADGTALKRPIGYCVQTSKTFPELTKGGKKGGKKR